MQAPKQHEMPVKKTTYKHITGRVVVEVDFLNYARVG